MAWHDEVSEEHVAAVWDILRVAHRGNGESEMAIKMPEQVRVENLLSIAERVLENEELYRQLPDTVEVTFGELGNIKRVLSTPEQISTETRVYPRLIHKHNLFMALDAVLKKCREPILTVVK